jgi:flagellar basal-body rod modification protein FlgD
MEVTSTSAASAAATSATTAAASPQTLDYSAFLRLLIAQLKNQDPTKPMDSAQFMGQLAAFSSVEQAMKTNAKLDALMSASALSQAEAFIGRVVASADGTIAGEVVAVRVTSQGPLAILDNGAQVLLEPGITVA